MKGPFFVDTNVLVKAIDMQSPHRDKSLECIFNLFSEGEQLFVSNQILAEFWVCATRPRDVGGMGMTVEETQYEIDTFLKVFTLVDRPPATYKRWNALVNQYRVLGKKAHDTRLVATMQALRIHKILTYNAKDFKRFDIEVIEPHKM